MTAPKKAPAKRATPHRPAGVRVPQDHLKPAAQREAEAAETVEFEFNGVTYTAPANLDRTKGVARALDQRRGTVALELLLGPKEFQKFLDTDPYDADYGHMLDAWADACGFENAGN
ncbi:hypothetical protein IU501_23070 [Nocardia otitidiscaviarum]|uniref:hypothetical protein n=1 Tax=Nocardia otitidiscaviarum TaxID=1823 RepID=UPI001893096A|nr:hypothetical protein [Nocardia otitidiscaviarum]MBF6135877.1 hypothetical protein [Nocardia otitidiscaviarum]